MKPRHRGAVRFDSPPWASLPSWPRMALPEQIDPFRLARAGESLAGRLGLAPMSRIEGMVPHRDAVADVVLHFYCADDSRPRVDGQLSARLQVRCQRCLEPVLIEIRREIRLMPVATDAEAAAVDADYEPLLVDGDGVKLADLVEDELILSMPAYPCHPAGACHPPADLAQPPAGYDGPQSPFRVLGALKRNESD